MFAYLVILYECILYAAENWTLTIQEQYFPPIVSSVYTDPNLHLKYSKGTTAWLAAHDLGHFS